MSTGTFLGDDGKVHYDQTIHNCVTYIRVDEYDLSEFKDIGRTDLYKECGNTRLCLDDDLSEAIVSAFDKDSHKTIMDGLIQQVNGSNEFKRLFNNVTCRFNVQVSGVADSDKSKSSNINLWKFSIRRSSDILNRMEAISPSGKVSSISSYRLCYLKIIMNFLTTQKVTTDIVLQLGFESE